MMKFHKYHGLGNDYVVLAPAETGGDLGGEQIRLICHRNYGAGGRERKMKYLKGEGSNSGD